MGALRIESAIKDDVFTVDLFDAVTGASLGSFPIPEEDMIGDVLALIEEMESETLAAVPVEEKSAEIETVAEEIRPSSHLLFNGVEVTPGYVLESFVALLERAQEYLKSANDKRKKAKAVSNRYMAEMYEKQAMSALAVFDAWSATATPEELDSLRREHASTFYKIASVRDKMPAPHVGAPLPANTPKSRGHIEFLYDPRRTAKGSKWIEVFGDADADGGRYYVEPIEAEIESRTGHRHGGVDSRRMPAGEQFEKYRKVVLDPLRKPGAPAPDYTLRHESVEDKAARLRAVRGESAPVVSMSNVAVHLFSDGKSLLIRANNSDDARNVVLEAVKAIKADLGGYVQSTPAVAYSEGFARRVFFTGNEEQVPWAVARAVVVSTERMKSLGATVETEAALVVVPVPPAPSAGLTEAQAREIADAARAVLEGAFPSEKPVEVAPAPASVKQVPLLTTPVAPPLPAGPRKSEGHVMFLGNTEYYRDAGGDLHAAPLDSVIEASTGHRIGRWEAPAHMADQRIAMVRAAHEQAATPVSALAVDTEAAKRAEAAEIVRNKLKKLGARFV